MNEVQLDLIHILDSAHRRQFPASLLVAALAGETKGSQRVGLERLAGLLEQGVGVVDAIEQTPGVVTDDTLIALRLGSEMGTLPETYRSILKGDELIPGLRDERRPSLTGQLFQMAISFAFAWLVIAFMAIFIVPTFQKMLAEFGISQSPSFQWLVALSRYGGSLLIFGMFAFGLLVWWDLQRSQLESSLWTKMGRFNHRPNSAVRQGLFGLLGLASKAGRPLASTLSTLARYHRNPSVRQSLEQTVAAMSRGEDGWLVLHQHQLLSKRQAEALKMTSNSQTQAWLLRQMAEAQGRPREWKQGLWFRGISTLLMLILASIVCLAAVAVFSTLYNLVENLA